MTASSITKWFFQNGDRVIGPLSESALVDLAELGWITEGTQVSSEEDSENWVSFRSALGDIGARKSPNKSISDRAIRTLKRIGSTIRNLIFIILTSKAFKHSAVFLGGLGVTAGVIFGIAHISERSSKPEGDHTSVQSQTTVTQEDLEADKIYQRALRFFKGERFPGESSLVDEVETKDLRKAEQLFANAGAMGHKEALFYQGVCLSLRNEDREAMTYFRQSAEKGYSEAAYFIGVAYMNGEAGLPLDQKKCRDWLRRASKLGSAAGSYLLATILLESPHFDLRHEAITLLKKASDKKHMKACQLLGECFADGFMVDCDPEHAVQLFTRAALQALGTPDEGKFGNHLLTAKTSHDQFRNALAYLDGGDLPQNKKNALYLLRQASQSGHESARKELARQLNKQPKRKQ